MTIIIKTEVYISLVYFASQFGRYMSKLSSAESEYLRAISVNGQKNLKASNVNPSRRINPNPIQNQLSSLSETTAYSI